MANSRKKGKKKLGFWLTNAEIQLLKDIAEETGLNMTDALRQMLINNAKQLKKGHNENDKS